MHQHRWRIFSILCWWAFAFACTRPAPEATGRAAADCDVLFLGGRIVDGSGAPTFRGDLCVRGDRIAELGALEQRSATRRLVATGLVVAPGFIDLLGQSEFTIFLDNRAASKITQGITSEITGEGSQGSAAHPDARHLTLRRAYYDSHGVPEWSNLESYFAAFVKNRSAVNLGTFVTAGGIREEVRAKQVVDGDEQAISIGSDGGGTGGVPRVLR